MKTLWRIFVVSGLLVASAGTPLAAQLRGTGREGPSPARLIDRDEKPTPLSPCDCATCDPSAVAQELTLVDSVMATTMCGHRPDYFPLEVGNVWVYQGGGIYAGTTLTLEITKAAEFNGRQYFLLHGFPGGDYWLRADGAGSILAYDPDQDREKLWWAFWAPIGCEYTTFLPGTCCGRAVVSSRSATYKGPIGESDAALELLYPGVFQFGIEREVFWPGLGLVFRGQATGGPSYGSYELIHAHVGRSSWGSARELSFGLALDNSVYYVDMMPPVEPQTSAPLMTARMTLRDTAEPIVLTFPTGQTFDFVIRNEHGDIVYRWSDGMAFTQVIRTEVLGPGEKDFVIQVRLVGPDKNPLPQGRYFAEGWLTTMGPRAFAASAAFEVRWVY